MRIQNRPVLIGDILISSLESDPPISVPSIGSIEQIFPKGSGFVPTGFLQKVIAWPNLALTWAGSVLAARAILRELWEQNSRTPFDLNTLSEFFHGVDRAQMKQVQIVGFAAAHGRVHGEFGIGSDEVNLPHLGQVGFIGSGTDYAKTAVREMNFGQAVVSSTNDAREVEAHSIIRGFAAGLGVAGSFVSHESHSGESLSNYFGAGYEVAAWADGRFAKLKEATFLYWSARTRREEVGFALKQVSKFTYVQDFLVIRTAVLSGQNNKNILRLRVKDRINVVAPVNKYLTEFPRDVDVPPFQSEWLCNCIVPIPLKGEDAIYNRVHLVGKNSEAPIKFIEKDLELQIALKKDFLQSMVHEYRRRRRHN